MIAEFCLSGPLFNGHFSPYWPSFILSKTTGLLKDFLKPKSFTLGTAAVYILVDRVDA